MIDRRFVTLVALGTSLVALPGCRFFGITDDYDYDVYSWDNGVPNEIPPAYNDGTLAVESSSQRGDMGEVQAYSAEAVATNATYNGSWASFRLDSLGEGFWVMSSVSISGLDIVNAPAGTYRNDSTSTNPVSISTTGCSGPTYSYYTFDGGANDTAVTITDNEDGSRTMNVRALFTDYNTGEEQIAEAVVTYRQGEVVAPPTYTTQNLVATDAAQDGTMGSITSYTGAATASEGYYYGPGASLRLDSTGDGWWVMSYLNVNNLDLATAPAGTYQSTSGVYGTGAPEISVTGCSGPTYGDYTFDSGSESVELTITDNEDGTRNADVVANFNGQAAHSTFRYSVTETTY